LDMDWLKKLFSNFHLYNYVLADAISYYITYQRNADLLYYWHWMNQLQSSEFYDYEGQINKQEFVYNSLRICILLKALGKEEVYKTFNAPCTQLQKYWVLYQGKINSLIDAFFAMNDESEDGVVSELLRFLNDLKLPDTLTPSAIGFHALNVDNEKCIKQLLEQIESGRVEPAWKNTTNEPNNEAVLLLHSLLLLVKQQNDKHKGNIALTRRVDNTPVCSDTDAPYLADPMGGIFTHNTTHRLNLFKYTATFYKLLWHVSLQQKAVMIDTVIRQKSGNF